MTQFQQPQHYAQPQQYAPFPVGGPGYPPPAPPRKRTGLVAGSIAGAVVIARKGARDGRKTAIPFGPFLAFGGLVALFAGDPIVDWYLGRFG